MVAASWSAQTATAYVELACSSSMVGANRGYVRSKVETSENIGKMVVIDVETGEYGVDDTVFVSSRRMHAKRPDAPLYAIRIGYNVSAAMGGVMERISCF